MTKSSLTLDNLEVSTFATTPETVEPTPDGRDAGVAAFLQANVLECTGCMSGCGIFE